MSRSRTWACLPVALLLLAGCAPEPPRAIPRYSISDFLGTVNYRGASFSPDRGKLLVSSDSSGIYNAYALPVAGGEPVALSHSTTDSIFALSYFPGDERFLYASDQGGNELTHVFVQELDGTARDLTPGERLKADFLGFARDGKSFFVSTNERDPRYFDLYEYAVDGYQRQLLFQDDTGYQIADASADRRHLALLRSRTTSDSDVYLFDRQTAEARLLTAHGGEVANVPQAFSADGGSLYFTSDEGSELAHLLRYDVASGEREVVAQPGWDVAAAEVSRGGRFLVVYVNADARTEIQLYEGAQRRPVALPPVPAGDIASVTASTDDSTLAFYVSSSRIPRDLYVYQVGGSEPPRQLTRSLSAAIAPDDLVEGRVVRFASYDGVEIPGILYEPQQVERGVKLPALVSVHGGPGGQSRLAYSAVNQYLVNHGYVVYAINNRGSSGYGKTFYRLDDRRHGEADLGDCVASKKMLAATGFVDEQRIGIIGGSYGGYMVLAALTLAPEEFALGVDLFGISNWDRTLRSIPAWWESFRQALYQEMGDPDVDAERLARISPLAHAGNIRRPLMVLQGANDPRVLKVESDEIVAAARANGVDVEYLVFDDEGHGFVKKENQARGYEAILAFLDRHLKANAGA